MNTTELELQKASLAREILLTTDENLINNIRLIFRNFNVVIPKKEEKTNRKMGFLKGKMTFSEIEDGKITVEEFIGI